MVPFCLSQPPSPPTPPPVSLWRSLARAGFLDSGGQKERGSWSLGGTVKGMMTAILLQPISEHCRPLTPVLKRTERGKNTCLPASASESDVASNALYLLALLSVSMAPSIAGLKDKHGVSGVPQSYHPPWGSPRMTPGIFGEEELKPPIRETESLLQRVGNSC